MQVWGAVRVCCNDWWCWRSVSARGDKKSNYECREGTRECRGAKTEKGELHKIHQMIRAISQCGNVLDGGKCYFLPVQFGVKGQWGVKTTTPDLALVKSYWSLSTMVYPCYYLLDMIAVQVQGVCCQLSLKCGDEHLINVSRIYIISLKKLKCLEVHITMTAKYGIKCIKPWSNIAIHIIRKPQEAG